MNALRRSTPVPPVRVVHLGLGNFHRTHQAWYTERANALGGTPSSIAAFTGRRPDAAIPLRAQDGLYHLLVKSPSGDAPELVSCLSAYDGADAQAWENAVADPDVGALTLTITEAGYHTGPAADRIARGLLARMTAGAGPLAVVSCDNLVDNGSVCRAAVLARASAISSELEAWIESEVSFVSTTVDRITPRTTPADLDTVRRLTGFDDAAVAVAEPYTEWVLQGAFPAGRPAWELAGARFVPDVAPYEQRKLWLLNGAHSLLAYAGPSRGHRTVAEAMADPVCAHWVEQWWDEACRHLALPTTDLMAYRADLAARFSNPAIRHTLAQIQADGSQKLPVRVLPVVARERAIGGLPHGGVIALSAWLAHLRLGDAVVDARAKELIDLVTGGVETATRKLLGTVDPTSGLADDAELVREIAFCCRELSR